ncbi:MAG: signal recognition particle protein [Deltaproteobacteria bacterium]|nr:signal recognition particle protein [Deltaproteobacteria bacterium]MBW2068035.1 signal recognition particle protein [Deltaproteobacteria bacterium]
MFDNLTLRLEKVFRFLKGQGKLNEQNIKEALREVRLALLEADVNYGVVKNFISRVRERALGQEVMASLTPGQQVIKIVHEELIELLGGSAVPLNLSAPSPAVIMIVGLQGSGKTTTAAKLALKLKKEKRSPYLVPADIYRPAAIKQLRILAEQAGVSFYEASTHQKPEDIVKKALDHAKTIKSDTVIVDTAGRLHIDEELMEELVRLKSILSPAEILLVADAMTGQEAVKISQEFHEKLGLTGVVLSKLDGDARGGAALSIRAVTGCPIKLVGTGEKLDDLETFHPDRMSSRILGMGDVLTVIEKAQEAINEEDAERLVKKLQDDTFTLEDFRDQLRQIKKLGSLEQILSMLPGMGMLKELKNMQVDTKELVKVEAIINSMTKEERRNPSILNASRKRRIARGSGTTVQDINRLLKGYEQARKMMKQITGTTKRKAKKGKKKRKKRAFFPF